MKLKEHKIKALHLVLPKNSPSSLEEFQKAGFGEQKAQIFIKNTGITRHFISDENTYASDLASFALQTLFDENLLLKNELDKLIVFSHTPDFFTPNLSALVHKNCILSPKTLCVDMTSYCTSFISGLYEAFISLECSDIDKVVLICVSVKSKKIAPSNIIDYASISDSASAILIEKDERAGQCHFESEFLSEFVLQETRPCSAYKKGFSECVSIDHQLFFRLVFENFPRFFKEFMQELENNDPVIFLQSANDFFHDKLILELAFDKALFFNEANAKFGNTDCNHLPLNLYLYKTGGGLMKKDKFVFFSFGTGFVMNAIDLNLKDLSFLKLSYF